jgi:hypothetical protein
MDTKVETGGSKLGVVLVCQRMIAPEGAAVRRALISEEGAEKRSSKPEELRRLAGGTPIGASGSAAIRRW